MGYWGMKATTQQQGIDYGVENFVIVTIKCIIIWDKCYSTLDFTLIFTWFSCTQYLFIKMCLSIPLGLSGTFSYP